MSEALLLIDLQRDFIGPDARMPVDKDVVDGLIAAVNEAVQAARAAGTIVIAVGNEFHPFDPGNFFRRGAAVKGSAGAAWDERVVSADAYFPKWRGDAFCNPDLESYMREREVKRVTVCGVFASGCVAATVKGALKRGFAVSVRTNAVADRNEAKCSKALRELAACGAGSM